MTINNKNFAEQFSEWIEEMKKNGESAQQEFLLQLGELLFREKYYRQLSTKNFASFLNIRPSTLKLLLSCDKNISIIETARILYKLGYEIKFSFIKTNENTETQKYIPEPVETE